MYTGKRSTPLDLENDARHVGGVCLPTLRGLELGVNRTWAAWNKALWDQLQHAQGVSDKVRAKYEAVYRALRRKYYHPNTTITSTKRKSVKVKVKRAGR